MEYSLVPPILREFVESALYLFRPPVLACKAETQSRLNKYFRNVNKKCNFRAATLQFRSNLRLLKAPQNKNSSAQVFI
jgi:hypothetical protein